MWDKGPFINYIMHLGGREVGDCVMICDGGQRGGGDPALLRNAKVYVSLTIFKYLFCFFNATLTVHII